MLVYSVSGAYWRDGSVTFNGGPWKRIIQMQRGTGPVITLYVPYSYDSIQCQTLSQEFCQ